MPGAAMKPRTTAIAFFSPFIIDFDLGSTVSASLRVMGDLRCKFHMGGGGTADIVDYIANAAIGANADRYNIIEFDVGIMRRFNRSGQEDISIGEHTIDAHAKGFVVGNAVIHLI